MVRREGLCISGEKRLATLPEVPAARELGVHHRMNIWAGLFAPEGLDKTLDDPAVQKRLAGIGGAIPAKGERSPAIFDKFVRDEIARWAPILKTASGGTMN